MIRKNIFIYLDEGVAIDTFMHITAMIAKFFPNNPIMNINAEELLDGSWQESAKLFVMPGGADLFYAARLNGAGNEIIKKYVSEGGEYLGICAGSYYASSYVEFDKNGPLEVIGTRELAFFPGRTIGPALSYYNYTSNEGATAAEISFINSTLNIKLYHHGGGFFEHADSFANVQVLANYVIPDEKNLAAIILVNYGHGKVLLSGVHFEVDPYMLNTEDPHLQSIINELQKSNEMREHMIDYILS